MSTATQSREVLSATRSHNYRPVLYATAVLLAVLTIVYSGAWMYYIRQAPPLVEIGIEEKYSSAGVEIGSVRRDTPAEAAGLKANDRIVAINGNAADSASSWSRLLLRTWLRAQPGDTVTLTVQRPEQSQPLVITPLFRAVQGAGDTKNAARTVAEQIGLVPGFFRGGRTCGALSSPPGPQCMAAGAGLRNLDLCRAHTQ